MTLDLLIEEGEEMSARELSEQIAERETEQSPPPRNIRQSAYVSLLQTHLPKLDELGVIEYDDGQKTVRLGSSADQLSKFMESGMRTSPERQYLIISLAGLTLILMSRAGLFALDPRIASALAGVVFAVGAGLSAYRLYQQLE